MTNTNWLDELEIQLADIFWVFGRRGFTDKETVADSVRKAMYQINNHIAANYVPKAEVEKMVVEGESEELLEIRDMVLTNYEKTDNYDMKILGNYCENRLAQLQPKENQ